MKKLYLLVLCMISAMLVNAQAPVWNVKVGLGASSWMGDGFGSAKALFNQRIGVGVDIPLTGWVSFQTGLNWTSKGAKYSLANKPLIRIILKCRYWRLSISEPQRILM